MERMQGIWGRQPGAKLELDWKGEDLFGIKTVLRGESLVRVGRGLYKTGKSSLFMQSDSLKLAAKAARIAEESAEKDQHDASYGKG